MRVKFWRRAAAFVTDMMIINLVVISQFNSALRGYIGDITLRKSLSGQIALPSGLYTMIFVISLLALFYFTFFEYYLGQTIGDILFKIKTIALKEHDGKIGLWTAALRNCYIIPFFPFYIFWIIEPLYLSFYGERFLERLTSTKTIMSSAVSGQNTKYKGYKLNKV